MDVADVAKVVAGRITYSLYLKMISLSVRSLNSLSEEDTQSERVLVPKEVVTGAGDDFRIKAYSDLRPHVWVWTQRKKDSLRLFNLLELVNAAYIAEKKLVPKPRMADASAMSGKAVYGMNAIQGRHVLDEFLEAVVVEARLADMLPNAQDDPQSEYSN